MKVNVVLENNNTTRWVRVYDQNNKLVKEFRDSRPTAHDTMNPEEYIAYRKGDYNPYKGVNYLKQVEDNYKWMTERMGRPPQGAYFMDDRGNQLTYEEARQWAINRMGAQKQYVDKIQEDAKSLPTSVIVNQRDPVLDSSVKPIEYEINPKEIAVPEPAPITPNEVTEDRKRAKEDITEVKLKQAGISSTIKEGVSIVQTLLTVGLLTGGIYMIIKAK